MNLDRFPEAPQQPKYTPEQLQRCLQSTDDAIDHDLKFLVRGMEISAEPEAYQPWPKAEVKKALDSILEFSTVKVKYYEGAGQFEEAQRAQEKVEELENIFSAIDDSEEVSADFLQTVQQAVSAELNLSHNENGVSDDIEQSVPAEKTVEGESSGEKINVIAGLINDLMGEYAKILRAKLEENYRSQESESIRLARAKVLESIIANLGKTQTTFLEAFNEFGALEMDEATLSHILQATINTGEKLEKIGF